MSSSAIGVVSSYLAALVELQELEQSFVEVAHLYGEMRGISREAWQEFGVPSSVLDAAGIQWTRRPGLSLVDAHRAPAPDE